MFDDILKFEQKLAAFTGAKYAIMTDCCTHAIELCLRYDNVTECKFTPFTYLSVPMTMHKLGIKFEYLNQDTQEWSGEYQFIGTRIWDSARKLKKGMYQEGMMQCLSFGHGKPLPVGRGGAILLDDSHAYTTIIKQRYDGRDLSISPWQEQKVFGLGYHYKPTIEEANIASILLDRYKNDYDHNHSYPDLRSIEIVV